jgi:hypothetical protein
VRDVVNGTPFLYRGAEEDEETWFVNYGCEARAILEAGSMEQKERMVEGYLEIYDEIQRDAANAMTDVQSVAVGNFDADLIRVWQYWITLDTLLTVRPPQKKFD